MNTNSKIQIKDTSNNNFYEILNISSDDKEIEVGKTTDYFDTFCNNGDSDDCNTIDPIFSEDLEPNEFIAKKVIHNFSDYDDDPCFIRCKYCLQCDCFGVDCDTMIFGYKQVINERKSNIVCKDCAIKTTLQKNIVK